MSAAAVQESRVPTPDAAPKRSTRFGSGEDLALALAMAALLVLPLAEMALRAAFQTSISGVSSFVQHLTLITGMLGAAIAARDGRLLELST
jgi:TRAP-type C4-dicarboxylate transport system permease small subunit